MNYRPRINYFPPCMGFWNEASGVKNIMLYFIPYPIIPSDCSFDSI